MTTLVHERLRPPRNAARHGAAVGLLLATFIFKAALEFVYVSFISPSFSYAGMTTSLSTDKLAISYIILSIVALILPLLRPRPSLYLLLIALYTAVIPILSLYALQDRPSGFVVGVIGSFVLAVLMTAFPTVAIGAVRIDAPLFLMVSVGCVASTVVWIVLRGGLSYLNFDMLEVYQFRGEAGAATQLGVFSYLIDWVSYVFLVVLLLYGLLHGRWWLVALAFGVEVFMFATLANKGPLFVVPFVLMIYKAMRLRRPGVAFGLFLSGTIMVGAVETWVIHTEYLTEILTRRLFMVPALLAYGYHDVFSSLGYVYWTNSYVGMFLEYPFSAPPPLLVSNFLRGDMTMWANNGIFGSGFMQAGVVGMLLYGCIFGGWMFLIDCITVGRVPTYVTVACLAPVIMNTVTDSDLPTALLTHGGLAITLMLWLWGGTGDEHGRPSHRRP